MTNLLSGKTYLVLGGARSGIGEAISRRLSAEGAAVVVGWRDDAAAATKLVDELPGASLLEYDPFSEFPLNQIADTVLDGFVFADMEFEMEPPTGVDAATLTRIYQANIVFPHAAIHSLAGQLRDGATITFITSTEAFRGSFGAGAYAAGRAAAHNLAMTFANRLGSRGVRANAVAPGWIGGVMDTDEVFERSRQITPLGRLGTPEEVAAAVRFLVSDEASFVSGTVLTVDGGYTAVDSIAKFEYGAEYPS